MQGCAFRQIYSELLNPAVKLPNQGCDYAKVCGNVLFSIGPARGTASLVIIIVLRDDGRLN